MCRVPKPAPVEERKPQYLHNPFLDENRNATASTRALRVGRSALRIPLGSSGLAIGFQGRGGSGGVSGSAGARGNSRRPGSFGSGALVINSRNSAGASGGSGPRRPSRLMLR